MQEQTSEMDILLSSTGLKKIEQELERLKTIDRKRAAERIREAKAFGDFAENSDYDDARNEQAYIEARIDELNAIMKHAAIIDETVIPVDHVGIGSVVRVKDLETLEEWEYRIVGAFEANPAMDSISNESPIGSALLNARIGDAVNVSVPAGLRRYEIVNISR